MSDCFLFRAPPCVCWYVCEDRGRETLVSRNWGTSALLLLGTLACLPKDTPPYRTTRKETRTLGRFSKSWVSLLRGGRGRAEYAERCVYYRGNLLDVFFFFFSKAAVFVMCTPPHYALEETGFEIRPRGCVISSPYCSVIV